MTLDITLYEYSSSRSKQARWALQELGLEFKSISGLEILHSDELNRVNPMGKVPAVVIDGEPLFEAAAICTYLADLVPVFENVSDAAGNAAVHARDGQPEYRWFFDAGRCVGREAIGGHDIEAHTRKKKDARRLRLFVSSCVGFEDIDLAGDIEIMRTGGEAGVDHRT